ncbi:hypothetical protein NQ317_000098 [Molorchus minor]|uniref:DUF1758 domain-containing protein n=1 Tax=Molorchus minor TaxID=1323400 RepID=A0ABQ9J0D6_9CUCU|nr:hypothetical protein NQ317_000098 [Molorchus minor]
MVVKGKGKGYEQEYKQQRPDSIAASYPSLTYRKLRDSRCGENINNYCLYLKAKRCKETRNLIVGFNVNTDSFTQLRARLDKCHDLYKEFDETQFHIQLIEPSLDDQERIKFEELYFDAVARANSYLECTIQHNERGNNLAPSSNDNPSHVAAIVIVYDSAGVEHNCRVLLDSGSQSNYITNEFCQRLKLKKYNLNMSASGLGQIHVNVSHQIKATIKSRFNNFKQNLSFLVLDKITDNLPLNKICLKNVVMPENIQLADPTCNVSSKIDALLGASVFWNLLSIGQIKISNSFLIAQKTKLGWILSGQVGRH